MLEPEKTIVEWTAPGRPYKERTREFYTTILSIVFLLGVILLLLKEFLLIGVIIAFAFLSYILSTHKPDDVIHQITTHGIRTDNKLYAWDSFFFFWLKKQYGQEMVICKTKNAVPGLILMVLDPKKQEEIVKALSEQIPLEKPEDSWVERASRWLEKKIPLENS